MRCGRLHISFDPSLAAARRGPALSTQRLAGLAFDEPSARSTIARLAPHRLRGWLAASLRILRPTTSGSYNRDNALAWLTAVGLSFIFLRSFPMLTGTTDIFIWKGAILNVTFVGDVTNRTDMFFSHYILPSLDLMI